MSIVKQSAFLLFLFWGFLEVLRCLEIISSVFGKKKLDKVPLSLFSKQRQSDIPKWNIKILHFFRWLLPTGCCNVSTVCGRSVHPSFCEFFLVLKTESRYLILSLVNVSVYFQTQCWTRFWNRPLANKISFFLNKKLTIINLNLFPS